MTELHSMLSGIGVSAGVAVGPLVIVSPPLTAPADEAPTTDPTAASAQVRDTLKAVADGLLAKAAKADAHAKPILEAGAMMAGDPGLAGAIDTQLQAGKGITEMLLGDLARWTPGSLTGSVARTALVAAEGESPGFTPYLIGGGTLVLLLLAVLGVAAFGKGRDHS